MAIPDGVRANFDTLLRAAENGDLALLECTDAKTGEPRYVLTAVAFDGTEYLITPFGHMCADENPFEAYTPPEPKVKMVCASCGSDDVLADAYAEWNADAQEWEVQNTFDKGAFCNQCDGETRLEEVEITDD